MRKYEMAVLFAMVIWAIATCSDKCSELKRCKISFVAFLGATMAIILTPNGSYSIGMMEAVPFFGVLWYGLRLFTKDILDFLKIVLRSIFVK